MAAEASAEGSDGGLLGGRASEILSATILSFSALLSSWSGYQAALWDGEQAAAYARAGSVRVAASRLATQAGQREGADVLMFSQWLDAYAQSNAALESFYRARFRPEFAAAFATWLEHRPHNNPLAPATPFAMPGYRARDLTEAQALERKADQIFEEGQRANDISDKFVSGTVFLALALFVCGIVQTFDSRRVRLGLLVVAILACGAGIARIFSLPTLQVG